MRKDLHEISCCSWNMEKMYGRKLFTWLIANIPFLIPIRFIQTTLCRPLLQRWLLSPPHLMITLWSFLENVLLDILVILGKLTIQ